MKREESLTLQFTGPLDSFTLASYADIFGNCPIGRISITGYLAVIERMIFDVASHVRAIFASDDAALARGLTFIASVAWYIAFDTRWRQLVESRVFEVLQLGIECLSQSPNPVPGIDALYLAQIPILRREQKLQQAIVAADKALAARDSWEGWFNKALLVLATTKTKEGELEAVKLLDRAISLNSRNYDIWLEKGTCLRHNLPLALHCFDVAISLNPESEICYARIVIY
jgi:tetratricopeptide (TPR) repeat protein